MRIDLNLQEGVSGRWRLSKFSVTEDEARNHLLRCLLNGKPERSIEAGTYWKLTCDGEIVMTNTPAEVGDHLDFIRRAKGRVLIAVLGLGMVLQEVLKKPDVSKVTVIEISEDVIKLTGKFYSDPRMEIVNANIYTYTPGTVYAYGWYDIWNYISEDNCREMQQIKDRLRRFVADQSCWCEKECKKLQGRNKRQGKNLCI